MALAARLARLELALGRGDAPPTGSIVFTTDGIHDASGRVIALPPAGAGPLSVILLRGPEPALPRMVAAEPPPPHDET